ncbi:MAG: hypothetical protein IKU15_00350 [Clostridia bacterium]|nr:hypothetical protein [Clostridia bacterium]MBR4889752.1 hypothetical protein [Clostridia bacterium]
MQESIFRLLRDKARQGEDFANNARGGDMAQDNADRVYDYARGYADGRMDGARGDMGHHGFMYEAEAFGDGRRGVKGSGRGGRRDRAEEDFGHEDIMLTKSEMEDWEKHLENEDGTRGPHFTKEQILRTAEHCKPTYFGYDKDDLVMTANMLYSDFCEVWKPVIPPDREAMMYCKFAKAWLEDKDAKEKGRRKLSIHKKGIVD